MQAVMAGRECKRGTQRREWEFIGGSCPRSDDRFSVLGFMGFEHQEGMHFQVMTCAAVVTFQQELLLHRIWDNGRFLCSLQLLTTHHLLRHLLSRAWQPRWVMRAAGHTPKKIPVCVAVRSYVTSDHIALRVDPVGLGQCCARDINGDVLAITQDKPVLVSILPMEQTNHSSPGAYPRDPHKARFATL